MQVKADDRIETFQDLIRVLKSHPEWLEELRQLILTTELLELPRKFEEFLVNEFRPLKKKVDTLEQDVAILKQDVAVLKQDVAVLKQDVKILKEDVGMLKGDMFEIKLREKAPAYFGRILKKCKVIKSDTFANLLDTALEQGKITFEERQDALEADLVVTGFLLREPAKKVFLVVEASVKADKTDIERAHKRAQIVQKMADTAALGVVICKEKTQGAVRKAKELDVILMC